MDLRKPSSSPEASPLTRHASEGWHPCLSPSQMSSRMERDMDSSLRWSDGGNQSPGPEIFVLSFFTSVFDSSITLRTAAERLSSAA